jgi:predicted nucleic acid-binding protein
MLFDTDVIVWTLRGNERAAKRIDEENRLEISAVSYMEVIKGARDKRELLTIRQYLNDLGFRIIPISENISHRAIIYMEEHALKSGMAMADALIAATAVETTLGLCTANDKHYKVISDLQLSVFRPK